MLIFKVGVLASHIGVHRNTVTNWIKKGKLKASPAPAKRYAISRKAFTRFCESEHINTDIVNQVLADPSFSGNPPDMPNARIVAPEPEPAGGKDAVGAVMVVGGGIAGIQAALDLADLGYYVYLIERSAGIGGTMAQLDKTFPTDDCASCIVLPKLVACGRHLNIEIITLARVKGVEGQPGNFTVRVHKKAEYVDADKCIACGMCAEKCPIRVPDEFNFGISNRKAVYIKCPQSVPLKYAIDPEACIWFTMEKCRACEKFCPTGAINFGQQEKEMTINVGAVVLAPGFRPFDPYKHDFYGSGTLKDVVTTLEFERLLSVSGPNKGQLLRPSDQTEPRRIAWLLCVGSRNHNNSGNSYCSNICCMAAVKQSMASFDHIKGGEPERTIFFTDLRSHGKESERYFVRAKDQGVRFIRALPHTLEPDRGGAGVRMRYMDENGRMVRESFDMVVLSIGFEAPKDAVNLSKMFGFELDANDFVKTSSFEPVETSRPGVFAVGVFQSPAAIPRSVVQASAACTQVLNLLVGCRHTLIKENTYPRERDIMGAPPAIGVFICSCGVNIAGVVDVEALAAYAERLPGVAYVENDLFSCAADAQESIMEKIERFNLNRVVIAACTPRTHEHMFRETLKKGRLNGFMLEMANIRNQNAWVHQKEAGNATRKARDQVRMAVAKVSHAYPLKREIVSVCQICLVVGGGVTGMVAALAVAGSGIDTILIERSGVLGGNARHLDTCFKGEPVAPMLTDLTAAVHRHPRITVHMETVLASAGGSVGNFTGQIITNGKKKKIRFGAALMAVGAKEAVPAEYGYKEDARVFTQVEFDRKVLGDREKVGAAKGVVFIQCVGSREEKRPYCSRICCVHSVKTAVALKNIRPELEVTIIYREIRTYGEWEEHYKEARDAGVLFVRYTRGDKPKVAFGSDGVRVKVRDLISGCPLTLTADHLVLASGVVARENRRPAEFFQFNINPDGFFNGAHPKLRPVDLSTEGLFLAGLCNYPKPMDESIEEARAAALRVIVLLSRTTIKTEAVKAFVTSNCDACALCVDVCPYQAISITPAQEGGRGNTAKVVTDPALCRGCGICSATCTKDGIMVHGFTTRQLTAQVRAAARSGNGGVRDERETSRG